MVKWKKCKVSAKSRTSLDREISRRIGITLDHCQCSVYTCWIHDRKGAHVINPVSSQRKPMVQPSVLSPLTVCQSKIKAMENLWPSTRVVKRIKMRAVR